MSILGPRVLLQQQAHLEKTGGRIRPLINTRRSFDYSNSPGWMTHSKSIVIVANQRMDFDASRVHLNGTVRPDSTAATGSAVIAIQG
jgi:hypothetical protein